MRRVTLRGLFARRTRFVLTLIAVALGVSLISATYIYTDTINGSFDSIFASFNVIDVLDDTARREFLSDMRARLTPAGLIIFSSHNLAAMEGGAGAPGWDAGRMWRAIDRPISELGGLPLRLRARIRNRRTRALRGRGLGDRQGQTAG